jgi:predicted amidophosphoribosyltransferase
VSRFVFADGGFMVLIPFSYLALLFSILPLLAFRSIRRRRRSSRIGLCPKCNYDLRAHAPGSLCPECGTPVTGANALIGKSQV